MESKVTCSTANATILACQKIVQSFNENIFELSLVRSDWTPEYARDLKSRIKFAKVNYLPSESCCKHNDRQQYVHELLITSLKKVSILRALIKVDFKEDKKFQKYVFEELGYNDYFSDAKTGDYNSLFFLMETLHKNMTSDLKQMLISKTIPASLVEEILTYDQQLHEFKSCFDLINASSLLSDESKEVITEIFSEIKDICRVATAYYLFDPMKRDSFCFFRVMIGLKKTVPQSSF
jgi:hypothetical protein